MKTRDIDVRREMHTFLSRNFLHDDDTVMIDELGLCQGEARIDIAIVNGCIHGYEIKSDSDTLERLPKQIEIYGKVLDTVTIVTGKNHTVKVEKMVPDWWGITKAEKISREEISLMSLREPKNNPCVDAYSIVQLLWKEEALELLTSLGLEKGYLSKSRKVIWDRLASSVPFSDLQFYIRQQLKLRQNWRGDRFRFCVNLQTDDVK